jgi:hypothetical protein
VRVAGSGISGHGAGGEPPDIDCTVNIRTIRSAERRLFWINARDGALER